MLTVCAQIEPSVELMTGHNIAHCKEFVVESTPTSTLAVRSASAVCVADRAFGLVAKMEKFKSWPIKCREQLSNTRVITDPVPNHITHKYVILRVTSQRWIPT